MIHCPLLLITDVKTASQWEELTFQNKSWSKKLTHSVLKPST